MNRRNFLMSSMAATAAVPLSGWSSPLLSSVVQAAGEPKVAVLVVDTDMVTARIDERIYGQFLEHINHSVEDGLFAEQIRGAGFEGEDFKTYWEPFPDRGELRLRRSISRMARRVCVSTLKAAARGSGKGVSSSRRGQVRRLAVGKTREGLAEIDA